MYTYIYIYYHIIILYLVEQSIAGSQTGSSLQGSESLQSFGSGSSLVASSNGNLGSSSEGHVILQLGGSDITSGWELNHEGAWQRGEGSGVSLSAFLALPTESKGKRVSFGTLCHRIENTCARPCGGFPFDRLTNKQSSR